MLVMLTGWLTFWLTLTIMPLHISSSRCGCFKVVHFSTNNIFVVVICWFDLHICLSAIVFFFEKILAYTYFNLLGSVSLLYVIPLTCFNLHSPVSQLYVISLCFICEVLVILVQLLFIVKDGPFHLPVFLL